MSMTPTQPTQQGCTAKLAGPLQDRQNCVKVGGVEKMKQAETVDVEGAVDQVWQSIVT